MRSSRVYVINKMRIYNLKKAEKFGQLIHLTEGRLDSFNLVGNYKLLYRELKKLREQDYILINSLSSLNFLAGLLCGLSGIVPRVLIFNKELFDYQVFELVDITQKRRSKCQTL